jgi:hypothetical protein
MDCLQNIRIFGFGFYDIDQARRGFVTFVSFTYQSLMPNE